MAKDRSSSLRFKGSSDQTHFYLESTVGKSRIRHRTTMDFEKKLITASSQNRIRPFPTLIKNEMAWVYPQVKD